MARIVCATAALALALLTGCGGDPEPVDEVDEYGVRPAATPSIPEEQCDAFADPPSDSIADITDVTVDHSEESVDVAVTLSELDPALEHDVSLHLVTPDQDWSLSVNRYRQGGRSRTRTFFSKAPREPEGLEEEASDDECAIVASSVPSEACQVAGTFDLSLDTVRATVPRRCMSNPAWVRVGVEVYFIERHEHVGTARWENGDSEISSWFPPVGPEVAAPVGAPIGCQKRAPRARHLPDGTSSFVVGKRPCIG